MSKIKVTVREHTVIEKEIEVEIPFYYKHNLFMDGYTHHIYGCIDGKTDTTIQEKIYDSLNVPTVYEIEVEEWSKDASYMKKEYVSDEKEFKDVKQRLSDFLSCI